MKEQLIKVFNNILLVLMFLFYPLFVNNGYYDIMRAKLRFNLIVFGVYIVVVLICFLINRDKSLKDDFKFLYYFAGLYVLSCLIGIFFASDKAMVVLGEGARWYGVLTVLVWMVSMLFISKYTEWNALLNWSFILGTGGVYLLQVLNQWKIDPLKMHTNLVSQQNVTFTSTMGNLNFNATFDEMTIAVVFACFLIYKEKLSKIVFGIVLFLGYMGMFCCRSASVYLSLAAIFIVLFGFCLYKLQYLRDFGIGLLIFSFALLILRILYYGLEHTYEMETITKLLMKTPLLIACFVISGALIALGILFREKLETKVIFRVYVFALLALVAIAVIGVIVLFAIGKLVYDLEWGTSRGYVWLRSLQCFGSEYNFLEKLFGCGVNGLGPVLKAFCWDEMVARYDGSYFIDAHSEYVQTLMTNGIVGFIGYFGMFGTMIVYAISALKSKKEECVKAIIVIVGIASFLAQALVNNPTIMTTPVMFVGLGAFWNILRRIKNS